MMPITKMLRGSVLLVAAALVACGPQADDDALDDPENLAPVTGNPVDPVDTLLAADIEVPSDSPTTTANGEIVVLASSSDEPLRLQIMVSGLPAGEHAWHIHQGACGTSGPVVIALSSTADMEGVAGPLDVDDSGQAEETVDVPMLDRSTVGAGNHSLHVHMTTGEDHGPTIACATI